MKEKKIFTKAFGLNEFGLADFPRKISNVQVSRLEFGNQMGCSWCFPHGFETVNSTWSKHKKTGSATKQSSTKTRRLKPRGLL